MNSQFTAYDQQGTIQHTYNSDNTNEYQIFTLRNRKSEESQKLTSAALRSPVIAPIDKRVGGFAACSINERVGEPPQPTPLGYEQRHYPYRRKSEYGYNALYSSASTHTREQQRRQSYSQTIVQHSDTQNQPSNKLIVYEPQPPQHQKDYQQPKSIAGSPFSAFGVQQQWSTLWQDGGNNYYPMQQQLRTNSLEHQQQQQKERHHPHLFSIPPTTTMLPKSDDTLDVYVRAATHHHQSSYNNDPFETTHTTASTVASESGSNSCRPTWSQIISVSASSTVANNVINPAMSQPVITHLKNNEGEKNSTSNNRVASSSTENQGYSSVFPPGSTFEINTTSSQAEAENDALPRPRANNATKLLSQSLSYTMAVANNPPAHPKKYAVAKISNIPWNASIHDIETLFKDTELDVKLPSKQDTAQCIHIIIDKSSGKTLSEAYVEFESEQDITRVLQKLKSPQVKTRRVYITKSSPEKLFRDIFPQWRGVFIDGLPSIADEQQQITAHLLLDSSCPSPSPPPPLVEGHEYESLLGICRNFKLHFSRKCAERPFENFISMIVKFPWDKPVIITTMQRDHLYEYYKLATGVLHAHLSKPNIQIDKTLMPRMVRAAIMCPGLTIPQKKGILTASEIACPVDLLHLIEPPSDDEVASSSSGDEHHISS
ncbi:hypothetical protein BDA99DRAFT_557582 [Phascolomyces articulosus]|uniref:RRM domain-containing protein n=1 Tax=Phascolomyces articulosus TaxID=60185 RepID=A0AAD5K617_9FUNG|nr:hypothetical protein BDA99DRAFT_557582 [Phascolomyces articulosus]